MFWFAVYVSLHYELISHRSHSDVQAVGTDVPMKGDKFVSVGMLACGLRFLVSLYEQLEECCNAVARYCSL